MSASTSENGVEIVSLSGSNIGISFNPIDDLTGNLVTINVLGSIFNIDEAYDGQLFLLNYPRNIGVFGTIFIFYAPWEIGVIYAEGINNFVDGEFLRLRLNGYF
jgi:hypothetical protein